MAVNDGGEDSFPVAHVVKGHILGNLEPRRADKAVFVGIGLS